jgi:hypothetical protein
MGSEGLRCPTCGHTFTWPAQPVAGEGLRELKEAVEQMPTARVISQWDLISRRAVIALIEGAPEHG